jgi:hypothetical protein
MELLSVLTARALWFIELRDLNPRGRSFRYTLFPALAEKYNFATYPYDEEGNEPTKEEPGFKFLNGEFHDSNGVEIMVNLTIFDDGLVAETRSSTRDSEAFLEELLQWAVRDFGFVYRPEMIQRKGYVSELNVTPTYSLSGLNPKLEEFAARLTSLVSTATDPVRFEPAGLSFSVDPILASKPAGFRFERRLDVPFSTNRYYTQASVHTDVHLELLDELEQILKG